MTAPPLRRLAVAATAFVTVVALGGVATASTDRPYITRLSITSGVAHGGDAIAIGGNFLGRPVRAVYFGNTRVARFTTGQGVVRTVTPAHAPGWVNIRVVTAGGNSMLTSSDRFHFVAATHISATSPSRLLTTSQNTTSVLLTGWSFLDVRAVTVSGIKTYAVHDLAGHRLRVYLPRPISGAGTLAIDVSTRYGPAKVVVPVELPAPRFGQVDGSAARRVTMEVDSLDYTASLIVRMAQGPHAPTGPTSGTLVARTRNPYISVSVIPGRTYSFAAFATDGHGHLSRRSTTTVLANPLSAVHWTSPTSGPVPHPTYPPSEVACADADWCMAIGSSGFQIRSGGVWTAPARVPTSGALSCATRSYCMTMNPSGELSIWDGTSWSALEEPINVNSGGSVALSCPSVGECVASVQKTALKLHDGTWSRFDNPTPYGLYALSCTSTQFCMGSDDYSNPYILAAGKWASSPVGNSAFHANAESCTADWSCIAVGQTRGVAVAYRMTAGHWSAPARFPSATELRAVSCASTSLCLASAGYSTGNGDPRIARFDGTTWTFGTVPGADDTPVQLIPACAPDAGCLVMDSDGRETTFDGRTWGPVVDANLGSGGRLLLSCPTSTTCMAVDGYASTYRRDGDTWSGPDRSLRDDRITSISCATQTTCVAVGTRRVDDVAVWSEWTDQTGWTTSRPLPSMGARLPISVSCPLPTFCMTLGIMGGVENPTALVERFDGSGWHDGTVLHHDGGANVSCPDQDFCMIGGPGGYVYSSGSWREHPSTVTGPVDCVSRTFCITTGNWSWRYDGAKWIKIGPSKIYADAVTCASAVLCLAYTTGGSMYSFDGTAWSASIHLSAIGDGVTPSCVRGAGCIAVGGPGGGSQTYVSS